MEEYNSSHFHLSLRFGNKIGIIADDEDQVDEDRTRYANFEYAAATQDTPRRDIPMKQSISRMRSNDSRGEPPAYEEAQKDGRWSQTFRDKGDTFSQSSIKKDPKIND